jgi:hypothetical protein
MNLLIRASQTRLFMISPSPFPSPPRRGELSNQHCLRMMRGLYSDLRKVKREVEPLAFCRYHGCRLRFALRAASESAARFAWDLTQGCPWRRAAFSLADSGLQICRPSGASVRLALVAPPFHGTEAIERRPFTDEECFGVRNTS